VDSVHSCNFIAYGYAAADEISTDDDLRGPSATCEPLTLCDVLSFFFHKRASSHGG